MSVGELRKVVFVAGGVGINPLMSMMSFLAEMKYDLEVQLLYASKVPEEGARAILFFERLTKLFGEGKLKGKLQVFTTNVLDSSPSSISEIQEAIKETYSTINFNIQRRRFTLDDVKASVGSDDRTGKLVYICGPPTMTDEMLKGLTCSDDIELESSRVMIEKWW